MKKSTLCLAALLTLAAFTAQAQSPAPARGVFTEADDLRETAALRPAAQQYARYRVLRLDMAALRTQLAGAALEFTGGPGREVALPLPQGGSQAFVVFESPVLSPALAAQYPDIKTYAGKAASGPATVRFSVMNGEFSAVYFAVDAGREGYVQPVRVAGQPTAYLCYSTADVRPAPRTGPGAKKNACATADSPPAGLSTGAAAALRSTGGTLRTYRLAVATTTGFTALQGVPANANTQAAGLLGVVDYVNVLNGVCRRELSMAFTLVSGTTTITTPTNNPTTFTNGNDTGNLAVAQAFMDAQIGNANYDIGHVFDATPGFSSGGGVASLQSLCDNTDKAQGVSSFGTTNATYPRVFGDQLLAHEFGHQFGMNHSFNSSIPVCTTRAAATSVEPGSGTTLMSYGYTCNDATGNDDYAAPGTAGGLPLLNFHAASLAQAYAYLATLTCGTATATGTGSPVLGAVPTGLTIPKSTPFLLTGAATGGGPLQYSWEGTDVGATAQGGTVPVTELDDDTKAPFFRSFAPAPTGTRLFPALAHILDGSNGGKGDKLPSVGRTVNLRLTVRDGLGGVNAANVALAVAGNAGPFLVTSNLSGAYASGQAATVTWSVNNTDQAPVSCANVSIMLSADGGQTFPHTVLASTPNTGSATVAMPSIPVATAQARLRVMAVGNVFFDISNADFALSSGPSATAAAALAARVLVFPNPAAGQATVRRPAGAAASAVLLNGLGQTVRKYALPTAETALDLHGLAPGVYALRLTLGGLAVVKRLVVE